MEFPAAAMSQLKEFAVTIYGARAYLALLEVGVADARAVSELANIPSAKVYGALVQLEKRGLAEVTPGKPRKYAPVTMTAFLERQVLEQEERLAELRARAREIAALFPAGERSIVLERPQTVTVEGKRNILQHLRESCQGADATIHVMISPLLRADLSIRRPFEDAMKRGIDVRFLDDIAAIEAMRAPSGARPGAPDAATATLIATFDARCALLAGLHRGPRKEAHPSTAIVTTDAAFVAPLHRLLAFTHAASPRGAPAAAASSPRDAEERVDARRFEELVARHAAAGAREACAVVHAVELGELERDRLWQAARAAARTRILLSPTTPRPPGAAPAIDLPPHAEVRFLPRASVVAFAILDSRRAFIVTPPRPPRERSGETHYAFTTDAALVRAFEAQFEAHWAMALPVLRPKP